jgi:predicted metal-dependent TIM-barrel fold hydrolase
MITIQHSLIRTDTGTDNNIDRQIKIKKIQLKIAEEGNMPFVVEAIQRQLAELEMGGEDLQQDSDFNALMSLLDN